MRVNEHATMHTNKHTDKHTTPYAIQRQDETI